MNLRCRVLDENDMRPRVIWGQRYLKGLQVVLGVLVVSLAYRPITATHSNDPIRACQLRHRLIRAPERHVIHSVIGFTCSCLLKQAILSTSTVRGFIKLFATIGECRGNGSILKVAKDSVSLFTVKVVRGWSMLSMDQVNVLEANYIYSR